MRVRTRAFSGGGMPEMPSGAGDQLKEAVHDEGGVSDVSPQRTASGRRPRRLPLCPAVSTTLRAPCPTTPTACWTLPTSSTCCLLLAVGRAAVTGSARASRCARSPCSPTPPHSPPSRGMPPTCPTRSVTAWGRGPHRATTFGGLLARLDGDAAVGAWPAEHRSRPDQGEGLCAITVDGKSLRGSRIADRGDEGGALAGGRHPQ